MTYSLSIVNSQKIEHLLDNLQNFVLLCHMVYSENFHSILPKLIK